MTKRDTFLRQWAMLRLVPRHPRKIDTRTIKEKLADEGFTTSTRTIQRDLMTLSVLFPLDWDDREKPYGWSWAKDAKVMDIPGMAPHEALTFRLAESFLSELMPRATLKHLVPHFQRAREVLKPTKVSGLGGWSGKVRILPRGMQLLPASIEPGVQSTVYDALLQNRQFFAIYLPRDADAPAEYEVNPLGLVFRYGVVYLVCTLWGYDDIKQLALHRLQKACLLDKKTRRSRGFDLDTYIRDGAFGYPVTDKKIRLKALFDGDVAKHLYETPLSENQKLMPQENGRILLEATVGDTAELRWWLQGFGDGVEVVGPNKLRKDFNNIITNMIKRYRG